MGYGRYSLRGFESYLRIVVHLSKDDIQLIFKEYFSKFFNYEISPGYYSIKHVSDVG